MVSICVFHCLFSQYTKGIGVFWPYPYLGTTLSDQCIYGMELSHSGPDYFVTSSYHLTELMVRPALLHITSTRQMYVVEMLAASGETAFWAFSVHVSSQSLPLGLARCGRTQ